MTKSVGVGRGNNPASWRNAKRGPEHHRWNNERMLNADGYVKIRVGCAHPLADPNGYAYEHLLIWCGAGNSRPAANEVLHHINENRADNRIENLRLMNRGLHTIEEHLDRDADGRFSPRNSAGRLLDGDEDSTP